jgi:hypothetical protein
MPEISLPNNVARLRPPVSEAEKEARRAEKRLRELEEPVEPWDRYRALRQTLDEAQKFEDLADHKARFAMILMGALNALVLFVALSELSGGFSLAAQPSVAAYMALCGLAAIYLFHQAIEALRPRALHREGPEAIGLRHHDDILRRTDEAYLSAWRDVRVEQLNDEIARQVRRQAEVNKAKETALIRLYAGLRIMMFLLVGLVLILVVTGPGRRVLPGADSGRDGPRAGGFYNLHPARPRLGLGTIPRP